MTRLLIIKTGSAPDLVRDRHGDFEQWFVQGLAADDFEITVIDVQAGQSLPESPEDFDGVLVTGSSAMVTDRLDWSERAAEWLGWMHKTGRPLLGVCYGHQLIAHALGGEVGPSPTGRSIGMQSIAIVDADDPLLGPIAPHTRFHVTHEEVVVSAPEEATVIARAAGELNYALHYGGRSWGIQFHPEFDEAIMTSYIEARSNVLTDEGLDPEKLIADIRPAPDGPELLTRFAEMVRQAAHRQ